MLLLALQFSASALRIHYTLPIYDIILTSVQSYKKSFRVAQEPVKLLCQIRNIYETL